MSREEPANSSGASGLVLIFGRPLLYARQVSGPICNIPPDHSQTAMYTYCWPIADPDQSNLFGFQGYGPRCVDPRRVRWAFSTFATRGVHVTDAKNASNCRPCQVLNHSVLLFSFWTR